MNLKEKSQKIEALGEEIGKLRVEVFGDMGIRGRANIASNKQNDLQAKYYKLGEAIDSIWDVLGMDGDGKEATALVLEKRRAMKKQIDELAKKSAEAEKVARSAEEKIRSLEEEKRALEKVGPHCPHCGKEVVVTQYPWP